MKQQPGNVSDAIIPDYSCDVVYDIGSLNRRIASKTQRVLVMGGSTIDCYCLPIFPKETGGAYLPVGNEGFVDPLQMYRVQYDHFPHEYSRIPLEEYRLLRRHIEDYYRVGIITGCQRVFWAQAPMSLLGKDGFALKRRPVLVVRHGLCFPLSTNGKKYISLGPAIDFGRIPGKVGAVPIYLPQSFFPGGQGLLLSAKKKDEVQRYLLSCLPKVFQNPF